MDEHIIAILVKEAIDKEIGLIKHEIHIRSDNLEDKIENMKNEN